MTKSTHGVPLDGTGRVVMADRARLREWQELAERYTTTIESVGYLSKFDEGMVYRMASLFPAALDALTQAEAKSAMSMASEAAAWSQRDEATNLITLLRDERDLFADQRDALRDELSSTQAAIQRVRDEHKPRTVQTGSKTHGGGPQFGELCSCAHRGPYRDCPTVHALDAVVSDAPQNRRRQ